jgi:hypothetical protein
MNHNNSDKIGNEYWKLRNRSGREKIFATPEALLNIVNSYFDWVDSHPFERAEQKKGNTIIPKNTELTDDQWRAVANPIINIPSARPYEFGELCVFMGVNSKYFNDFEDGLKGKEDPLSLEFSDIVTYVQEKIRSSIIMGGMLGTINPMLASRYTGLKEKQDISVEGEIGMVNVSFISSKIPDTQ